MGRARPSGKTAGEAAAPPRPTTIQRISNGVFPAFAFLSALQLELFTVLKDGPMSAEEVAAATGCERDGLERLLYALVSAKLLTVEGGRFANTAEADCYLVQGRPRYMGDVHHLYSDVWQALLKTSESIRTGSPQARHDFSAMSEDELAAFLRGLAPGAAASGHALAKHHDFSTCETLVDVGGGSGALAVALCRICPHLKATVVELPTVAPITRRFVDEAGAGGRIRVVAADVVREPLGGPFDVAVLRNLIQTFSADEGRRVLANAARALRPGGSLYVIGAGILDDSRIAPLEAVGLNLVFLNVYDQGRSYTEREYREWFAALGLRGFRRIRLEGGYSMLSGRKRA